MYKPRKRPGVDIGAAYKLDGLYRRPLPLFSWIPVREESVHVFIIRFEKFQESGLAGQMLEVGEAMEGDGPFDENISHERAFRLYGQ